MEQRTVEYKGSSVTFLMNDIDQVAEVDRVQTFQEMEMLQLIERMELGGTYVDVGANIGNHAIFFSLFTPAEQIICFEPMPETMSVLKANLEVNKIERVTLIERGILDTVKFVAGNMHEKSGQSTLLPDTNGQILCGPLQLDEIKNCTLVKIDVEGLDIQALKGCIDVVQRDLPEIFIETFDKLPEVTAILEPLGYSNLRRYGNSPTYHFSTRTW